jgi:hypothetical protein
MKHPLLALALALTIPAGAISRHRKPLVIVISLDGFLAYAFDDARLPIPTWLRCGRSIPR